jgi:membrane protein DedA with SNARE-associated domain
MSAGRIYRCVVYACPLKDNGVYLRDMEHFITTHGLPLLFLVVMAESFGLPLPGETALVAFSLLAAQGHYSIWLVVALAAIAAIIGDNLGYWLIGRLGGNRLLQRWPWFNRRFEAIRPSVERLMERHGGLVVFGGRFIAILRFTAAWIAGLTKMRWGRFMFWNALGGIVWAGTVGLVSYYGGQTAAKALSRYGAIGGLVVAVILIGLWIAVHLVGQRIQKRILRK